MKHLPLEAWPRPTSGTSGAVKVRNEGFIPCVVIGHKEAPSTIKIKSGDMTRILKEGGRNAMVDITVEGQSSFTMVREFTRDPVSRKIIHVEFQRMVAGEAIEAFVPLTLINPPASAIESGFVLNQELATLHVKALPDSLPGHIDVDVSHLEAGHAMHVSDIALPEGVQLAVDPTHIVAVLTAPGGATEDAVEESELVEAAASPAA